MGKYSALVLNSDYLPHRVVDWRDAVVMVYSKGEKAAHLASTYEKVIHDSMGIPYNLPAVVVLNEYVKSNNRIAQYSKKAIYLRDRWLCQFCGKKIAPAYATIDHVIPRSRRAKLPAGFRINGFENCVTACFQCNAKKADRTPQEAGMRLLKQPKPITKSQKVWLDITTRVWYPDEWKPYIESIVF